MFIKIFTLVILCMILTVPVLAAQSNNKPAEDYAPVCRYQNDCPYAGDCDGQCYGGQGRHHAYRGCGC